MNVAMISATRQDGSGGLWQPLTWSLVLLLALLFAHDVDHVVNEDEVAELTTWFWIFLPFQYAAFGLTLALVLRRDARAPRLAGWLAAITVIGFLVTHVLPFGIQPFSDVPTISWILVFVPMGVALVTLVEAGRLVRAQ